MNRPPSLTREEVPEAANDRRLLHLIHFMKILFIYFMR